MKSTHLNRGTTTYSRHAALRMQQRCIPAAAVDLLLDFARPLPAGDGARSYRFNRKTWADAAAALGPQAKAFARFRNAYVIESADGAVITAAWLQ